MGQEHQSHTLKCLRPVEGILTWGLKNWTAWRKARCTMGIWKSQSKILLPRWGYKRIWLAQGERNLWSIVFQSSRSNPKKWTTSSTLNSNLFPILNLPNLHTAKSLHTNLLLKICLLLIPNLPAYPITLDRLSIFPLNSHHAKTLQPNYH